MNIPQPKETNTKSAAERRLLRDLQRIMKENSEGISATPSENNLFEWDAMIEGIEGTPWENGVFELRMTFTENYPNQAPKVVFKSQMFHPNIYHDGRICLDILQNQWSSVFDVWAILTSIRSLLSDPNTLSPANSQAALLFTNNRSQYERRVIRLVEKSLAEDQS